MPRPWSEETDDVPGFRVRNTETPGFRVQENPMAPFGEGPVSPASDNAYPAFADGGLGGDSISFEQGGIVPPWAGMIADGNLGNESTFPGLQSIDPFFSARFTMPVSRTGISPPSPQTGDISGQRVPGFRVGREDTPGFRLPDDAMPTFGQGFDRPSYANAAMGQVYRPFDDSSSIRRTTPVGYGFPFDPGLRSSAVDGAQAVRALNPRLRIDDRGPAFPDVTTNAGASVSPIPVQYNPDGDPLLPLPLPPQSQEPQKQQDQQKEDAYQGQIVVLPDGSAIEDEKSPTGFVMSPKADLRDVAAKGRRIGEAYRAALADPETSPGALPFLAMQLGLDLGHAGTYDHQRSGNMITGYTQYRQFRPIANVNVGLLGQQAGLTLEETLSIAGRFAGLLSSNADPKAPYGLDSRTLYYIRRGYEVGQSGMFDPPTAR